MVDTQPEIEEDEAVVGLADLTNEEMRIGMSESTRFVAQTFLSEQHYKSIHQTLSNSVDKYHSMSAAVKLMESYGVTMSKEEEKKFAQLPEDKQISKLVSKMPSDNNDQFQQFFMELQLLVSTAMRLRRALEEGRTDEVKQALEDAATTGIASYILNVAIVQAGAEIKTLKGQFLSWTQEADTRMGRLLRGQTDNITAQRALTMAESKLKKMNGEQNTKAGKVVMNFVRGDLMAFIASVVQGWREVVKKNKWEVEIRLEYGDRLKDLEDNLAKVKAGQISKCECVVLKKIQQENAALLGIVYDTWRKDTEEAAFQRENGDKIKAMEERLAQANAGQKEKAKKVMAGMASKGDKGLKAEVLAGWIQLRLDTIKQKQTEDDRLNRTKKIDDFAKNHSEKCKYVIKKFAAQNDGLLVKESFEHWQDFAAENKAEADIAEKMAKSQKGLNNFKDKNKGAAGSVMNRAAEHQVLMLLGQCFSSWKLDSTMERSVRGYHTKIDAKRGQLVGVQQMFRNFASQLESGAKEGKDSSRIFAPDSKKKMPNKGDQGSVSLPDIKKSPNSQLASGRSGKVSSKQLSQRSSQGEAKVARG